ncbi:prolipoprotein diacylglyceryl transferase [Marinicella rhabdoformis]|uniref:prolipoprotein diacylglyceryl transferase n=1 Tax=Marinicella rhabdoformis TaxID=2580566 RepID=UPI0012AEC4FB|nr:prolipoprotein diacylglyceryl transferase [Marinicella rhabdoformis]
MNSPFYLIDFDPVFLSVGPVSIHWYGVTYLIGFAFYWLLGTWMINNRKTSWDKDQLSDFMFYGALGVIVGGRLGWVAFYNDASLLNDPLLIFRVWEGGMSFHGGLMGVITAMFYFSHKTKRHFLDTADFIAPLAPLGIFSVRMGNFINGELWGRLSQHPWAMIFPDSLPLHLQQSNFVSKAAWLAAHEAGQFTAYARHPSPLYEALGEGLLAFFLVWAAVFLAKKRGTISAVFLLCYASARFSVEFIREPDANRGFIFFDWMTMGHILTLPLFALAILILVSNRKQVRKP